MQVRHDSDSIINHQTICTSCVSNRIRVVLNLYCCVHQVVIYFVFDVVHDHDNPMIQLKADGFDKTFLIL